MYCLWLNGKKVYTLQQLRASFDVEAVRLYCLGGSLARWLRDCGEPDTAEKVANIDLSQNISAQLADIFGVDLPKTEEQTQTPAAKPNAPASAANGSFALPSSFAGDTSFSSGSFGSSFSTSSFGFSNVYTSFLATSFLTTSFGYEYEYEYESGSFTTASFSLFLSSFFAETAFLSGSFTLGSFTLGSFSTEYASFPLSGSFPLTLSSFSPGSAEAAPTTAAPAPAPEKELSLTPQQKFELNLSSNPLNRYGYGIHLI